MLSGVRGGLIATSFARDILPGLAGFEAMPSGPTRELDAWSRRREASLGPASGLRAIVDVAVVPLLRLLGYTVFARVDSDAVVWLRMSLGDRSDLGALIVGWDEPLTRAWRTAVVHAIAADARWCFCCNGTALRIVDARRTWSREYLEFDLTLLAVESDSQALLWALMRAETMAAEPPLLDRAVALSARHGVDVCRALGSGVLDALQCLFTALAHRARARDSGQALFEQCLTVLYRVLFLLFAEARVLVPMWHPVYRDRYSLEAIVTTLLSGGRYRGLWRAIQAISRLAHAGCAAGGLKVTAFNGRLFAPEQAAAFDRTPIADDVMRRAVVAVSSTPANRRGARARIIYSDLDVEQLGAVYEQVLEYAPGASGELAALTRNRDGRKASGTFYTPRAVTAFLVRRTLEPLVAGRRSDDILALRVLDPAMGSGAFLVAACRYLAAAVEDALLQEGRWHPHDITVDDRASVRREVASRCLFGVDLNPMAVQLARLSLWLATLSAEKPLSFLDHHLVPGDSLVGATAEDVQRQPSRGTRKGGRAAALPLFEAEQLSGVLRHSVGTRLRLTREPDDSAAIVRAKERTLAALQSPDSILGRWRRVLDAWCAGWFWDGAASLDRGTFGAVTDRLLQGRSALPERTTTELLTRVQAVRQRLHFLHWPLTFPEVFADEHGEPLAAPGFDAIVGNPPWDMMRGDSGEDSARDDRRVAARQMIDFVRESGVYRVDSRSHVNRYQLFVERALQLVRRGGRIGLVLPSGIVTDAGAAPLRRHLFDRAEVDELTGLDNRDAIFPIHRGLRFVLLTGTLGQPTTAIRCRFGISRIDDLERPDSASSQAPIVLTRRLVSRVSGEEDLGIPELGGPTDLRLVERISVAVPKLASEDGWQVQFGRELNASDDRDCFVPFSGSPTARPIVEGKQIEPFRVSIERCRLELRPEGVPHRKVPHRPRLAYRDVASATNRLTLIAAIVPARAVTTHTLFCLKTALPVADQHVLCALLNSFAANYLIRFRVNTHVTVTLVSRLPVPVVRSGHPAYERLSTLARALTNVSGAVEETEEYAALQALVATLYGLDRADFEHVLSTFPLIADETKARVLSQFELLP